MAKNNNNKKGNNMKKRPNYFEINVQMFGEDFLTKKNPLDIQRDAKKIFMDISRGNIDIDRDSYFFTDYNFLLNIGEVAYDNWKYHNMTIIGMKMFLDNTKASMIDRYFLDVLERHQRSAEAYGIICEYIQRIMNNMGARVNLHEMSNRLSQYRDVFSEMFIVVGDLKTRVERGVY